MTVEQLERLISGAVSLVRAREERILMSPGPNNNPGSIVLDAAGQVLRATDATSHLSNELGEEWRRRILWVDDRPNNNVYERQVFESLGLTFILALSTEEALGRLSDSKFGAIISDMGRKEGPREGYRLLDTLRASGIMTPFFIYAGSNAPQHKREAVDHGAQGCTNMANELVDMVVGVLSSNEGS